MSAAPAIRRVITWAGILLVVAVALHDLPARGQAETRPAGTETTIGTVTEVSDEFILVRKSGDAPRRHWFKWAGVARATPDEGVRSTVAKLKEGDTVEVRWSFDDRRRIESVAQVAAAPVASAPATQPFAPPAAVTSTSAPSTAPAATSLPTDLAPSSKTTLGERVNGAIDDMLSTGSRMLQLPLFMLLGMVGVIGLTLAMLIRRLNRKGTRPRLARGLMNTAVVMAALAALFIVDRRIARLQDEVAGLRTRMTTDAGASLAGGIRRGNSRKAFQFDEASAQQALAGRFGDVKVQPVVYDDATDVVDLHFGNPLAQAYLAVIDLRHPAVEIKFGGSLDRKTLTSAFARENDCSVAINGEAGSSPMPGSGLGPWRGEMVKQGQVVLKEEPSNPRPFLSFDRQSRAAFTSAGASDRSVAPDKYNVIWGRWDAIVRGNVPLDDSRNRQPRTAMAINADGTRLYLLVVDGRQPRYSMGLTKAEAGHVLKAFGASDGMLCDEGGSACIYLKQFGGIANSPSDGQERTTYTHFGVSLRGS